MSAELAYLDSSAFVKTIKPEAESAALERYLHECPRQTSSRLLLVEAVRAARVHGADAVVRARARLRLLTLTDIDSSILENAAMLNPLALRSLDAIHLATALQLGPDLGVIVTYDQRLADAAKSLGLPVSAPG